MNIEVIYGQVVGKANNYQAVPDGNGGRRIIKNKVIRSYEKNFVRQCKVYKDRMINGRFILKVAVYYKDKSFDLDNSLKTILDCLQMVKAIVNDNLCYKIIAEKRIDRNNPRIVYGIQEYEPKIL